MTDVNITIERAPLADLKRKYETRRRHFLEGRDEHLEQLGSPFIGHFEAFGDLERDIVAGLTDAVQEGIEQESWEAWQGVDLTIRRSGNIGSMATGAYRLHASTPSQPVFDIALGAVEAGLYTLAGGEQTGFLLDGVLTHLFRNHLNREYLQHVEEVLSDLTAEQAIPFGADLDGGQEAMRHLLNIQSSGLASFSRRKDGIYFPRMMESLLDESRTLFALEDAQEFSEELRRLTRDVDRAIPHLQRLGHCAYMEIARDVLYAHKDHMPNPLGLEKPFHPVTHGNAMIRVIALAELRRELQAEGKPEGIPDLFVAQGFSKELERRVVRTVAEFPSMGAFFDTYYQAAERLGMDGDQMVIRPEIAAPYLVLERECIARKGKAPSRERAAYNFASL